MKKHLLLSTIAGLGMAISSHAQVVAVNLTGDAWATADGGLANGGSVMNSTNIQPAAGYNGPALLGGAVATNAGIGNWTVSNNGGSNGLVGKDVFRLSIGATTDGAGTKYHRAVIFFDQSAFSNGLDSAAGGVTLDSTTSLSYMAKRTAGLPSRIGYVLQADGNYFLHQIAYNDNQAGGGAGHIFTLADPTAVSWNSFDPTVSFETIGGAATPDFTKVTGIGIWFENERVSASASGLGMQIGEITFNAIPEPSAALLLLGGLGGLFLRRSRR